MNLSPLNKSQNVTLVEVINTHFVQFNLNAPLLLSSALW
jgi:hypothetical protein